MQEITELSSKGATFKKKKPYKAPKLVFIGSTSGETKNGIATSLDTLGFSEPAGS